jgi:hypothetical protein
MNQARLELPEMEIRSRTQELFEGQLQNLWNNTDKLFVSILIMQWITEIVVSLWLPAPALPTERGLHFPLWEIVVGGGLIIAIPCLLAIRQPGQFVTRTVIAAAQGLSLAVLIHLSGGSLGTHLHVFASLALLAFYRDWRVLILTSMIVTCGYLMPGICWPQSTYGTATVDSWRFVEYATWIVVEDAFLLIFCRHSMKNCRLPPDGRPSSN